MRHIPVTDRNEDGSATVCSQCERPDECGLTEVAHAGGPLYLCGVCFDELPACENCGERGGEQRSYDHGVDPETGYHDAGNGCSLCLYPDGGPKQSWKLPKVEKASPKPADSEDVPF